MIKNLIPLFILQLIKILNFEDNNYNNYHKKFTISLRRSFRNSNALGKRAHPLDFEGYQMTSKLYQNCCACFYVIILF